MDSREKEYQRCMDMIASYRKLGRFSCYALREISEDDKGFCASCDCNDPRYDAGEDA